VPAAAPASVAHGDWCECQGRWRVSGTPRPRPWQDVSIGLAAAEDLPTRSAVNDPPGACPLEPASRGYRDGLHTVDPTAIGSRSSLYSRAFRGSALDREAFNDRLWARALRAAGVDLRGDNGMHALRHFHASVLLDAGGGA
jgi:hypothetical protein